MKRVLLDPHSEYIRKTSSQAFRRAKEKKPFKNIQSILFFLTKPTLWRNYFPRYYLGFIQAYLTRERKIPNSKLSQAFCMREREYQIQPPLAILYHVRRGKIKSTGKIHSLGTQNHQRTDT